MSDYNEEVRKRNDELAEQIVFGARLKESNGTDNMAKILDEILIDVLGERSRKAAVEALTNPVAFALSMKYETGYKAGDFSARQAVANKLQLGKLEVPGGK